MSELLEHAVIRAIALNRSNGNKIFIQCGTVAFRRVESCSGIGAVPVIGAVAGIDPLFKISLGVRWNLAFQSRAGDRGKWLGPDPELTLEDLMKEGLQKVLICPIGFITDHLETLYDLDIALKEWAEKRGIEISRTSCLNDAPELIEVLVQLVEGVLERG